MTHRSPRTHLIIGLVSALICSALHATGVNTDATVNGIASSPLVSELHFESTGTPGVYRTGSGASRILVSAFGADFFADGDMTLQLRFPGAQEAEAVPEPPNPVRLAFHPGETPARERPTAAWERLRFRSVYEGIDVVYYGNGPHLEYDFLVAPGADPGVIRTAFAGVRRIRLNSAGDLVLETAAGEYRQRRPVAYQERDGKRTPVEASYDVRSGQIRLSLGAYDRALPLTIDPLVEFPAPITGSEDRPR